METNGPLIIAVIEQAGVPVLRVGFTVAVGVDVYRGNLLAWDMTMLFRLSNGPHFRGKPLMAKTIILKPYRRGWEVFEASGVQPYFGDRKHACF